VNIAQWNAQVKKTITITFIVYAALAFGIILTSFYVTAPNTNSGGWDNFAKTAGVGITLLTSVLTAITTLIVLSQQQKASHDIEALKSNLATDLEIVKRQLSAETEAYKTLSGAATVYYYSLAILETGTLNSTSIADAEKEMIKASSYLSLISENDTELWNSFWQRANFVAEKAKSLSSDSKQLKELWAEQSFPLGSLLERFRESYRSTIRVK